MDMIRLVDTDLKLKTINEALNNKQKPDLEAIENILLSNNINLSDIITITKTINFNECSLWKKVNFQNRKMDITDINFYFVEINIHMNDDQKKRIYNGYLSGNKIEETKYVMVSLHDAINKTELNNDLIRICGLYNLGSCKVFRPDSGNIKNIPTGMVIYEQNIQIPPNNELCVLPNTKSKHWNNVNDPSPWDDHYTVETSHNGGYFICDATGVAGYYIYLNGEELPTNSTELPSNKEVIGFITYVNDRQSTVNDYKLPITE